MATESHLTSIKIASDVRDKIRACKRGGETYTEVLRKMAQQYDPDAEQGNT